FFLLFIFFFIVTPTTAFYTLSLHDALPIYSKSVIPPASVTRMRIESPTCAAIANGSKPPSRTPLVSTSELPTRRIVASVPLGTVDRKSTRLNSSHVSISYAVFCLKKKNAQH